ncbi:MAG: hypothetical protein EHM79_16495 [Geobacter sp.]|nr:MAG: hypothetical protein EHM79_16495 [Geobacter sp.]
MRRSREELEFKNIVLTTQQENSIDGILLVDKLDGSTVPVEVASVPLTFRGENVLQVIARDITD